MIEASDEFERSGYGDRVTIEGVDLIPGFLSYPPDWRCLRFETASLAQWQPTREYDLVTCVHGLHYIGDKLKVIKMAVQSLKADGVFVAHLDLDNLKITDGAGIPQPAKRLLTETGFEYDTRRRILKFAGKADIEPFWRYVGADDKAGPNSTGQPAVNSHYLVLSSR